MVVAPIESVTLAGGGGRDIGAAVKPLAARYGVSCTADGGYLAVAMVTVTRR